MWCCGVCVMMMLVLNVWVKFFVLGVGIVILERGGVCVCEGVVWNLFEDDDCLVMIVCVCDDVGLILVLLSEDDDVCEVVVELDVLMLLMDGWEGVVMMEWVWFDDDDDDDDDDGEGEDAMTANDVDDVVWDVLVVLVLLLKYVSLFYSDVYGVSVELLRVEDNATLRESLLRRGDSYGAVEDVLENLL